MVWQAGVPAYHAAGWLTAGGVWHGRLPDSTVGGGGKRRERRGHPVLQFENVQLLPPPSLLIISISGSGVFSECIPILNCPNWFCCRNRSIDHGWPTCPSHPIVCTDCSQGLVISNSCCSSSIKSRCKDLAWVWVGRQAVRRVTRGSAQQETGSTAVSRAALGDDLGDASTRHTETAAGAAGMTRRRHKKNWSMII